MSGNERRNRISSVVLWCGISAGLRAVSWFEGLGLRN